MLPANEKLERLSYRVRLATRAHNRPALAAHSDHVSRPLQELVSPLLLNVIAGNVPAAICVHHGSHGFNGARLVFKRRGELNDYVLSVGRTGQSASRSGRLQRSRSKSAEGSASACGSAFPLRF